jgi:hypothetical protein
MTGTTSLKHYAHLTGETTRGEITEDDPPGQRHPGRLQSEYPAGFVGISMPFEDDLNPGL